jgi:hypothetical protein
MLSGVLTFGGALSLRCTLDPNIGIKYNLGMQLKTRNQRATVNGVQFHRWFVAIGLVAALLVGPMAAAVCMILISLQPHRISEAPLLACMIIGSGAWVAVMPSVVFVWVGEKYGMQSIVYYMVAAIICGFAAT